MCLLMNSQLVTPLDSPLIFFSFQRWAPKICPENDGAAVFLFFCGANSSSRGHLLSEFRRHFSLSARHPWALISGSANQNTKYLPIHSWWWVLSFGGFGMLMKTIFLLSSYLFPFFSCLSTSSWDFLCYLWNPIIKRRKTSGFQRL